MLSFGTRVRVPKVRFETCRARRAVMLGGVDAAVSSGAALDTGAETISLFYRRRCVLCLVSYCPDYISLDICFSAGPLFFDAALLF